MSFNGTHALNTHELIVAVAHLSKILARNSSVNGVEELISAKLKYSLLYK